MGELGQHIVLSSFRCILSNGNTMFRLSEGSAQADPGSQGNKHDDFVFKELMHEFLTLLHHQCVFFNLSKKFHSTFVINRLEIQKKKTGVENTIQIKTHIIARFNIHSFIKK